MHILKITIFAIFSVMFLGMSYADAAQVYFEPQPTTYKVGDSFTLSLVLDTEGQSVNAVDIKVLTPKLLKIKNISKSGSIIQLWVNEPSFSGETINIVGGIPSGTTTSKGTIVKVTFEAMAIGEGNLAFMTDSSVLLNDGQGTRLDLKKTGGPVFNVIPRPKESPKETIEAPQEEKEIKDDKKPEAFKILIGEDPRVFGGQKFVSFFTTDKGSGVTRYEIKEGNGDYKIARSPYLLTDQEKMRTVIRVRAYDASENYKESVYPGFLKRVWWQLLRIFRR